MSRSNFVPRDLQNNVLAIAAADPGQVQMSDELPLLLGKKLLIRVATARQIGDLLKRTEQSQRVLEQATEAFTLQTSKQEEEGDETISGDRLTRDSTASPVVRLVETIIFTALERRASDIHIEARDTEVAVKYRIDGVLQHAMQPIAKEWHSTVLSRIKVLSELDIAERRVPQDGRFRDVQLAQHFDAGQHGGMPFLGDGLHGVLQHAVDTIFDGHFGVTSFDVDVAGAALECGEDNGLHEAHHRAGGAIATQSVAGTGLA